MHSICNLKCNVPEKIHAAFLHESNYDYHFIIKQKNLKNINSLGENTEKYITFTVPIEKEVMIIDKIEQKLQKIYLTCYNLLIVQDLWQAYYQIFLIIFLKEFLELNVNRYDHKKM